MKFVEIKSKEQLNNFLAAQEHSALTQSWEWGEFNVDLGNKVSRFGVEEDGKLLAVLTLLERKLPLGMKYWYCPRGPVVNFKFSILNFNSFFKFLIEEISGLAKREGVIFLRLEPLFKIENLKFKICRSLDVQPSKTLLLDLSKTEDELLKEMHQKTRYNIRLAEKKGVLVVETQNLASDFEKFWQLMTETKERDGFRLHSKEYYFSMLKNFQSSILNFQTISNLSISNDKLHVKLFLAKYNNEVIASGIFSFFGDTATYLHGASSNKFREVMAPYALQWGAIKMAKELGCKYYDFSGISETKWPGVTRFKKGFGGFEFDYAGTWDAVFNNWLYKIYGLVRKARRLI